MKVFLKTLWHFSCKTWLTGIRILFGSLVFVAIMLVALSPVLWIIGSFGSFLLYHVFGFASPNGDLEIVTVFGVGMSFLIYGGFLAFIIELIVKWFKEDCRWHWEQAKKRALQKS